jgi:hypothetical protein
MMLNEMHFVGRAMPAVVGRSPTYKIVFTFEP